MAKQYSMNDLDLILQSAHAVAQRSLDQLGFAFAEVLDDIEQKAQKEYDRLERIYRIRDRQMNLIAEYAGLERKELPQGNFEVHTVIEEPDQLEAYLEAFEKQIAPYKAEKKAEIAFPAIPYDWVRGLPYSQIRGLRPLIEQPVSNGQADATVKANA